MMRIIKVLTAALLIVSMSFTANAMADKKYYTIHEIQEQAGEMLNAAGLTTIIQVFNDMDTVKPENVPAA